MMQRVKNQLLPSFVAADASYVRTMKLAVLGRERSLPHLGRKFYHFLMGMVCFSLYAFILQRDEALLALLVIGGAFVLADLVRLRFAQVNQVALRLFGKLMRREELKSISGNSFFILGLLTVVCFFPKPIVLLSVLYLAIGDPSAAVVGSVYGKRRLIGKKSLEGAMANFVATSFATLVFANMYLGFGFPKAAGFAFCGGLVSVVSELFPAPVDDNFSIPVLSAALLSILNGFLPFC